MKCSSKKNNKRSKQIFLDKPIEVRSFEDIMSFVRKDKYKKINNNRGMNR